MGTKRTLIGMRFGRNYAALGFLLLVVGCSEDGGGDMLNPCPDIGCISGLRLLFDRVPEDGTIISIEVDNRMLPWPSLVCGDNVDCSLPDGIFLPGFKPYVLTVDLTAPSGETTSSRQWPVYDPGKFPCAGCFNAEIMLEVPS